MEWANAQEPGSHRPLGGGKGPRRSLVRIGYEFPRIWRIMRRRMVICLGILVTLCVLGNAIAMLSLDRSIGTLTALAESHRIQTMRANLASSGVRVETDLLTYRLGQDQDEARRAANVRRFEVSLNQCGSCHHEAGVQARLDELRGTFESYVSAIGAVTGDADTVGTGVVGPDLTTVVKRLTQQATDMADLAADHISVRSVEAAERVHSAWMVLLGTVLTAVIVAGIVALHLERRLSRPVQALLDGVARVRQGDQTHRFAIRADREFRTLGEAFDDAYEELRRAQAGMIQAEKMAAVGKLAAGVAHEVGNPLASISSVAQMMRRQGQSAEQAQRIDLIMEHIGRISRIVRELLAFAKPATTPKLEPVQIADLIERATTLLRYDRRARNIEVTCEVAPDLPAVRADADRLLLVFTNVILNAFDALSTSSNGAAALRIAAEPSGQRELALRFEDNGPGMDAEQLSSAFEPFFTTKEPGAGTGLGLWISYQVIREHGGTIWAESTLGRGTTVHIRLPVMVYSEEEVMAAALGDAEC